jgi:hypothetical protein
MAPRSPSRAARIGYRLVTVMLVLVVAFGAWVVISAGFGAARHGNSLLWSGTVSVSAKLNRETIRPLPNGLVPDDSPRVSLLVFHPSTGQMLLAHGMQFAPLILFAAGLWLLRGLARSVLEGDPFGPVNVQRLRRLGYLLVLGTPALVLVSGTLRNALIQTLPDPRADVSFPGLTVPPGALIGGLGAFILAEVFAHGVRLREDVEGTV